MVIYIRAILVAVRSECRVKRVICKTWTGTLANSADSDQTPQNTGSDQVCTVCLNYRVKVYNPFRSIFPAYTYKQSTICNRSTDEKLAIFFFFFLQKISFDIPCKLPPKEMPKPIFLLGVGGGGGQSISKCSVLGFLPRLQSVKFNI